jgi:transglutaminase-like putative cysteine protease
VIEYEVACELHYAVHGPAEFVFNIHAARNSHQQVLRESFHIDGATQWSGHDDPDLGNRLARATAPKGALRVQYTATVRVNHTAAPLTAVPEVHPSQLPSEVLRFLLPSRYCESDRLLNLAMREFGKLPPGATRVEAVCEWVHQRVRFQSATSNASTSALDTIVQGVGVCRDFAHLTISLLRALNIPARLVTGYDYGVPASYGPTDFHAYVEAWLGGRWWIFDATRLCPRTGLVRIGTGHDAVDTAFATIFGPAKYERMRVDIKPHAPDGRVVTIEDDRTLALSTAGLDDNLRWLAPPPVTPTLTSAA